MAGYKGHSMSNNAVDAYTSGEKPYSKWNKANILEWLNEDFTEEQVKKLEAMPLDILKGLLVQSSWHHTSKHYNETDFYSVSIGLAEDLLNMSNEELAMKIESNKQHKIKQKEKLEQGRVARVVVNIWGGTRNHPKIIGKETYFGIAKGDWLYYREYPKSSTVSKVKFYTNRMVDHTIANSYAELKMTFKKETPGLTYFNGIAKQIKVVYQKPSGEGEANE